MTDHKTRILTNQKVLAEQEARYMRALYVAAMSTISHVKNALEDGDLGRAFELIREWTDKDERLYQEFNSIRRDTKRQQRKTASKARQSAMVAEEKSS